VEGNDMNVMEMQKDGVNYFVEYTDKISMFDKVPELIGISEPDQVLPVDLSELDINSVKTPFPKRSGRRDRVLGGVDFVDVKNPLQGLREDFFDALGKVLAKMADSISNEIKQSDYDGRGRNMCFDRRDKCRDQSKDVLESRECEDLKNLYSGRGFDQINSRLGKVS